MRKPVPLHAVTPVQRWTTDALPPDQRLRAWRDVIHASVVEMDCLPVTPVDFFSRIDLCPLGRLVPHQVQGSPQRIRRSNGEIARAQKNAYCLISQRRCPWSVAHAGPWHEVAPGESVLVDSRIPYDFDFSAGLDDLSIELPIDWLERWVPDPARILGRPLNADAGWGLALRGLKEALEPRAIPQIASQAALVEDQLGLLIALSSESLAPLAPAGHVLYQRCIDAIRSRFQEHGLSASEVAAACGISLRTLHRAFAAQCTSFASELMRERAAPAARMLAERRFRHLTVAEIGRRCGFMDDSHFARQFRRSHGRAPGEFRRAALGHG